MICYVDTFLYFRYTFRHCLSLFSLTCVFLLGLFSCLFYAFFALISQVWGPMNSYAAALSDFATTHQYELYFLILSIQILFLSLSHPCKQYFLAPAYHYQSLPLSVASNRHFLSPAGGGHLLTTLISLSTRISHFFVTVNHWCGFNILFWDPFGFLSCKYQPLDCKTAEQPVTLIYSATMTAGHSSLA